MEAQRSLGLAGLREWTIRIWRATLIIQWRTPREQR